MEEVDFPGEAQEAAAEIVAEVVRCGAAVIYDKYITSKLPQYIVSQYLMAVSRVAKQIIIDKDPGDTLEDWKDQDVLPQRSAVDNMVQRAIPFIHEDPESALSQTMHEFQRRKEIKARLLTRDYEKEPSARFKDFQIKRTSTEKDKLAPRSLYLVHKKHNSILVQKKSPIEASKSGERHARMVSSKEPSRPYSIHRSTRRIVQSAKPPSLAEITPADKNSCVKRITTKAHFPLDKSELLTTVEVSKFLEVPPPQVAQNTFVLNFSDQSVSRELFKLSDGVSISSFESPQNLYVLKSYTKQKTLSGQRNPKGSRTHSQQVVSLAAARPPSNLVFKSKLEKTVS